MEDLVLKAKKGNREAFLKLLHNMTGILYKNCPQLFMEGSRLPVVSNNPKPLYNDINELKDISGTKIKLNTALLDLKCVSASYSDWGSEK